MLIDQLTRTTSLKPNNLKADWHKKSTQKKRNSNKNFVQMFVDQAINNPDQIAAVALDGEITYAELHKKSDNLARYLNNLEMGRGNLIGICSSPTINFLICLVGILKAGAAYFPLDPNYPSHRLSYMLEDTNPSLIIAEAKYFDLFELINHKNLRIEDQHKLIHDSTETCGSSCRCLHSIKSDDLAYVIYTSGSTGDPKGIMVTHKSLPNIAMAHNQYFPSNIRMLVAGGVCFDASLLVIFHALINGEQLYLFDYNPKDSIDKLFNFINDNHINYLICVPSHYAQLLQNRHGLPSLKCVSSTGENLPRYLCKLHASLVPNAILFNEYGPSECAIGTTIAKIYDPKDKIIRKITVGKPLANTEVYILDQNFNLAPPGSRGEIFIGGIGLARGYLNKRRLTHEKFVKVKIPDKGLVRLYRTGDLGRRSKNGELEYLGRTEQQANISGEWVDLGEIEHSLSGCSFIGESVLEVKNDANGRNCLIVYITTLTQKSVKNLLTRFLKRHLPDHALPSQVIQIDKFPLSPNGKVDREALRRCYG